MRRQLRREGGIMDITPRENFGLGSKLKKFTRKIIPNEIADIAVKAAPFVAPFNPAAAAAMAGLGGFDQTGSIGDSLKSAALTYGGGQLARYAGGAGFQQNPFTQGGAFRGGLEGFKAGFTSPFGTETGIGKMLDERKRKAIGQSIAEQGKAKKASFELEGITGVDKSITADAPAVKSAVIDSSITADAPAVVSELTSKSVIKNDPSIFNLVKEGDYGKALVEGAKKFGKAVFTNKDGSLDKTALLAAGSFGLTYLDAKRIANEAGEDITVEEYDEASKAEFKEKYDGYLQNFFGGKADGGRVKFGDGPVSFSNAEKTYLFKTLGKAGGPDRTITFPKLYGILKDPNNPNSIADAKALKAFLSIKGFKSQGGRIGYKNGDIIIPKSKKDAFMTNKELEETMPGLAFGEVKDYENMKKMAIESFMEDLKAQGFDDEYIMDQVMKQFGGKFDTPSIKLEEKANGGRIGFMMGSEVPIRKNQGGVMELDYRQTGGFVPVGIKEKADDVPAMLSKNEFVMTADAVRGIGNGSVEKGAEKLYDVMKQAEKVGRA